jgi:hypothetical protein
MKGAGALLLGATLMGCASPASSRGCAPGGGSPVVVYELFFGRSIDGRAAVSDTEWDAFVARVVTPNLPDGFTVLDGEGQWRDPATHTIMRDPTKVLIVAAAAAPQSADAIDTIRHAYQRRFGQKSVGMIRRAACADFAG